MFSRSIHRTFNSSITTFSKPVLFRPRIYLHQNHTRSFSITRYIMAEWKLKDITSLDLKDYDKKEVEVEGIDKGKVLLVKVKGKISALNANCTHFGAPLKNGVLTPDGRLTCPWHGACFNVANGDVEDAPAPDHLNKFDVYEKDGAVYIKAQEDDVKSGRRKPNPKPASSGSEKVVIIGGGSGAFGALEKLRQHGFNGSITVISNEGLPIDRTKLSKALITDASKVHLRTEEYYKDGGVNMAIDTATGVDFSKKTVSTKSGSTYPYTKLILASGGTPKKLPLPGFKELSDVHVLRHIQDTQGIMNAVGDGKKKIVIVGSSFIGMEAANALVKNNDVSVIGMEGTPLENIMGAEVGKIFQKNLEKAGGKLYMNAEVDSAYPASAIANAVGLSKVGGVKLKDGTDLPADLVILGIGVAPATEYLKENSAVELNKDGSLNVDEGFAVKGLQDVYAIGDIASYPYHGPGGNGKSVRIEHWNVAQNMGRSVGYKIADPSAKPNPFIPIFWSAQGGQLRYCGHTPDGFDDVILHGEPENAKFAAYYAKNNDIVAVASMGMDPIMAKCAELMRTGEMLSKSDIKSGKDVLQAGL